MTVYFLMYFLILFGSSLWSKTGKTLEARRECTAAFPIFWMILVLGLRHPSMGTDLRYGMSGGYLGSFKIIANFSWGELFQNGDWLNYERGYILYNKILSLVSTSPQWLLFVSAFLSLYPLKVLFKKYSKNIIFSYIVYLGLPCFMLPFSGLRQAIAIGICCLATIPLVEKKRIKFCCLVLLAMCFHSSAVIYFVSYPLFNWRIPKNVRECMIPILVVIYLARYPIFSIASRLFKENAIVQYNSAVTLLAVFVLVLFFCQIFMDEEDREAVGFLNIFYFACVCQCFAGVYNTAMRVGYYFMPAIAVALPSVVMDMKDYRSQRISYVAIMTVFLFYGLYALSSPSWAMTNPYHFFWCKL